MWRAQVARSSSGRYGTTIDVVAEAVPPPCSVAVKVMSYVPAAVYVCGAVGFVDVVGADPSPQLNWYCEAGADTVAVAVTVRGGVVIVALTVAVTAVTSTT